MSLRPCRRLAWVAPLLAAACARPELSTLEGHAAVVSIQPVEEATLLAHLASADPRDRERLQRLRELFDAAGCREGSLATQPVLGAELPNLICTLPGETDARIVVGATFRRPRRGIADDWTGAAMLPSLYSALRAAPRRHTFEFIGFSDAMRRRTSRAQIFWNRGAEHYVRQLDAQGRERIRAMVGLLGLGYHPTAAWASHADPHLWLDFGSVTQALGLPLRDVGFEPDLPSEAEPFRMWGLPSITLHSHDRESLRLLENPMNARWIVDRDLYVQSYRLVAFYLGYLDQSLAARRERARVSSPSSP